MRFAIHWPGFDRRCSSGERLPDSARTPASMTFPVIHAVDKLNEIVTRLLYFSRADSTEQRSVQVNRVLKETLELLAAADKPRSHGDIESLQMPAQRSPVRPTRHGRCS